MNDEQEHIDRIFKTETKATIHYSKTNIFRTMHATFNKTYKRTVMFDKIQIQPN